VKINVLFLAKLLGFSLLLFACQKWVMMGYELILLLAMFLLSKGSGPFPAYYDSAYRIIPFLALVLATPGLSPRRRLLSLLGGLSAFWAIDLLSFMVWGAPPSRGLGDGASKAHYLYSLFWELAGHWVLPILLWIIAAHRQLGELLLSSDPQSSEDAKATQA